MSNKEVYITHTTSLWAAVWHQPSINCQMSKCVKLCDTGTQQLSWKLDPASCLWSQGKWNIITFKYAKSSVWSRSEVARGIEQEVLKCKNIFVLEHFYLLTHRLHWSMLCWWLLSQGKKTIDNLLRSIKIILIRKLFLLKLFVPRWSWLGNNTVLLHISGIRQQRYTV